LIYRHGWIMAFWIGGYMVAGLTSKGVLAKRLNQVSRLSGAITVPDVLRDRFQSPLLSLLASVFMLIFLAFNLVGQFKAVGLIMREASGGVRDTALYQHAREATARALRDAGVWREAEKDTRALGDAGVLREAEKDTLYDQEYPDYVLGMLIFALTVVAYTTYGGFWAVTWTDVLQGLIIVGGAVLLMVLALSRAGSLGAATTTLAETNPKLLTGPGPDDFLPLGLAVSYFFLWTIGAMGQPVGMVRLMACRDTPTLRRSLFMIGIFYALIYMPLVITFVCARAIYGGAFLAHSDRAMPAVALLLTRDWPVLGGLLLAAPYAAAMSAVAGFLLLMSSSLVRDIYQRNINPDVSPRTVKTISYATTAIVGTLVTVGSLWPPRYLQYMIIFTTSGMACTFLAPTVLGLYWRRATRAGAVAALLGGFGTLSVLWILGFFWNIGKEGKTGPAGERFAPLYLFDLDPLIYGLVLSFVLGIAVSLWTEPPPAKHVDGYFVEGAPGP
jgi:SSS family solute:Na+ symporter/sodium/pantothenate symporter